MNNIKPKTYAEILNKGCSCITLDKELLRSQLESDPMMQGIFQDLIVDRPTLFSSTSVFLSVKNFNAISSIISSIEEVIKLPLYQKKALERSPDFALKDFGPKGVFMGYDFHLHNDGPKLIEINTNAGGALLNLELAKAQESCCISQESFLTSSIALSKLENIFCEMFMNEWRNQKGDTQIGLVAIIDDDPKTQYLYPEFQLFQRMFSKHNIKSVIIDPSELKWREGKLWFGEEKVDLIYNRLTDFYFEDESHSALRSAYQSGAVVVTPSPHHHSLYANKLNLVTLSNKQELDLLQVSSMNQEILLQGIPKTEEVRESMNSELWERRKNLFFKPISGFGSKATYRGDKLTKKVWESIIKGGYVAQQIVSPGERVVKVDGKETDLKLDIRVYVYDGLIQLMASRLYSGQTTNFRTDGGGFAPVFVVPEEMQTV